MTVKELEKRILALEEEVRQLKQARVATKRDDPDWQRAVEKWSGDEDILAVIREGMKLREQQRRTIRRKPAKPRRKSA